MLYKYGTVRRGNKRINLGSAEEPYIVSWDLVSFARTSRDVLNILDEARTVVKSGGDYTQLLQKAEDKISSFSIGFGTDTQRHHKYWPMVELLMNEVQSKRTTLDLIARQLEEAA